MEATRLWPPERRTVSRTSVRTRAMTEQRGAPNSNPSHRVVILGAGRNIKGNLPPTKKTSGDGVVGFMDLLIMLSEWGDCR